MTDGGFGRQRRRSGAPTDEKAEGKQADPHSWKGEARPAAKAESGPAFSAGLVQLSPAEQGCT